MKSSAVAIVGMAGRFPGARSVAELWRNLRDGVESIRDLSDAELLANGVAPEELATAGYVKRAAVLDDVPMFDAGFFGFSPRDASIMDPQHRHFLECAWEALEDAGHPPSAFQRAGGSIGVFAGSGLNSYLIHNLLANRGLVASAGLFQLKQTGNDKDVLSTRVSYQLDLRGPSINVQTACSTSLVAVHLACQSLLNFECDMALAGGVTIEVPHGQGYMYREGEILSRDGHCRSFDASSSGTVFASGLGIVVLRRLDEALADRDQIHAVILGSAINNDGARKVGYLAPSVEGQAEVIAEALEFAGVGADEISYIEAHGTGTVVGDPIEVRALTQAFRRSTARAGFCGLGSLKSNLGHLDAAAGVSGLIKTALALKHAQMPASLHFERINPRIEIADSPFYVNDRLHDWPADDRPRRAGVTALGIGGTNAHVVLEAPPPPELIRTQQPYQLLTVSAKTESAADRAFARLAEHVAEHPDVHLADVAFTCQIGRQAFPHRRAVVVEDTPQARAELAGLDPRKIAKGVMPRTAPGTVFLFSGQGSQYVDMGREMYEHEPVFRDALDTCARILREPLGLDLIAAIYPGEAEKESASERLSQTWLTQPALFALEYALAQWWMAHDVQPAAMGGHSLGEYVAACLAGVFSLQDALGLVAARGRMIAGLPPGAMLSVPLAPEKLQLAGSLSIAAINHPDLCVVSGPFAEIAALEESLAKQSILTRRLVTSHAFHSAMMEPMLADFEERLRSVKLHPPRIPYLSNVTGTWIQAEEATDPAYWARHVRSTVRFSENLTEILHNPDQVLIECGPGNVLTSLARMQGGAHTRAYATLPHPRENAPALRFALQTLGQLWSAGVDLDFARLHVPCSVQRVSLPAYPFEHQRFWIEPDRVELPTPATAPPAEPGRGPEPVALYRRTWKATPLSESSPASVGPWLIFHDALGLGEALSAALRRRGERVVMVAAGAHYQPLKDDNVVLRPAQHGDYEALAADLANAGCSPSRIIHLWAVVARGNDTPLDDTLARCFYSPLFLAQALAANDASSVVMTIVSNALQQVEDETIGTPERAVLFGVARTLHKELPGFTCQAVDLDWDEAEPARYAQTVLAETCAAGNLTVAYRRSERFVEALEGYDLGTAADRPRLRAGGVYLITGGLGALGLEVAEHLARTFQARLVLVGRTPLPPQSAWETALQAPGLSEQDRKRLRKLIEIRSLGGGLAVAQADVTDLAQMRAAVALAQERFGGMDGVLHAAGVLDDAPLLLKSAESAARVLAPKVQGTLVLEQALQGIPLRSLVLFSSISSIDPPAGQVDYAAANAFLDAFALSRKGSVQVVNWGAWREVGMAARAFSPHPWLQERLLDAPDRMVFAGRFSSRDHWALAEHRVKEGPAIMPGTAQLELVAGAWARHSAHRAIEFRDVFFEAPLAVADGESREVRVQLQRDGEEGSGGHSFRFAVLSRDQDWIQHSTGSVAACRTRPGSPVDRSTIAARCRNREIVFCGDRHTRQEIRLSFGPRWHSLRKLYLGQGEALTEIELDPQFAADVADHRQHPALLDMATGACLYLTHDYDRCDDLFLPITYRHLRVYRRLPACLFSHIRACESRGRRSEVETFDITVFDEQGEILAEIEGFTMRRIVDPAMLLQQRSAHALADRPFDVPVRTGIAPDAGVQVLTRILQAHTPAAVVALGEPLTRPAPSPAFSLPASRTDASPAQIELGGTEATLATWWRELLGVEQVGTDDDFFELGGHSLTGVRLIAKIKRAFRADLELATLFEARTVRQLAAVIDRSRKPSADHAPTEKKAWKALVPIQPNGGRPPLFCVHAVGGDVLFYQQLARALGSDQPFYAFQSPLVAEPEREDLTIEEMAALYIREMREFYPSGPYLLGGASYGGFVLYEMARQLHEQGIMPAAVLMFDVRVPGSGQHFGTEVKLQKFWGNIRREGYRYLSRKMREKARYFWDEFTSAYVFPMAGKVYRKLGRTLPPALRFHWISRIHWRVLDKYTFKPFPGKITQVRAADRGPEVLGRIDDPTLGWKDLALGGVEIIEVPTQHMVMLFEPYVTTFAGTLKALLAEQEAAAAK
ncbi:MAG: type I polyketide synthase [Acidobacteriota bacterium]